MPDRRCGSSRGAGGKVVCAIWAWDGRNFTSFAIDIQLYFICLSSIFHLSFFYFSSVFIFKSGRLVDVDSTDY